MSLSTKEKARRYVLIREKMKADDLSALLIVSNAQINYQGFVRYFTNLPIPIYSHGLFFPVSGDPILLTPSPLQTFWAKQLSWMDRENVFISKSFGRNFGEKLIELGIQEETVGLISFQTLSAQDLKDLMELCPNVVLRDASEILESARSSKGEEEIGFAKRATAIAETAHQTFRENMRPGISERELVAKVEERIRAEGGERSFYLISSNIERLYPYLPGETKISEESPLLFSVEVAGPGGYWSQIVRTHFWGVPDGILERLYGTLMDLRTLAQRELRPGRRVKDVAGALRDAIHKNGFEYGIHFGHGLGLDVVEEPLINTENERILGTNHFVTIHPHLIDREQARGVWMGDMYFVGEEKTEILSPMPSGI